MVAFVGALVAEFVGKNNEFIPRLHLLDSSSPSVYAGHVVRARGAFASHLATRDAPHVRDFSYDDRVSIIGYCIGQAIPTPGTKILNEKWLILKSGLVTPAAYVSIRRHSGMHSQPCPRQSGEVGGPHSIRLMTRQRHKRMTLRAKASDASTVGFALFYRHARHWRPIGLLRPRMGYFSAPVLWGHPAVAMAVACWGPRTPAHPDGTGDPVKSLKVIKGNAFVERRADDDALAGARTACSERRYGIVRQRPQGLSQRKLVVRSEGRSTGRAGGEPEASEPHTYSGEVGEPTGGSTPEGGESPAPSGPSQSGESIVPGRGKSVGIGR